MTKDAREAKGDESRREGAPQRVRLLNAARIHAGASYAEAGQASFLVGSVLSCPWTEAIY